MSQAASSQPPAIPNVRAIPKPAIPRVLTLAALAVLLWFIAKQSLALYNEYRVLRVEMTEVRNSAVIGYPGIQPRYSFAQPPTDWYHVDGETARLWSGWREGSGHMWFLANAGDIQRERMSLPMGRDVYLAIDLPVVEFNGGSIWGRIPESAHVVGGMLGGVATAYPILVLERVYVVNDQIRGQPFLVTYSPLAPAENRVVVYEPIVAGQRLTMGVSGYHHNNDPMLFDRGTESLWVREGDSLSAIAGKHRGEKLRQVIRPIPISWNRWRDEHPQTRLVVGAERNRAAH